MTKHVGIRRCGRLGEQDADPYERTPLSDEEMADDPDAVALPYDLERPVAARGPKREIAKSSSRVTARRAARRCITTKLVRSTIEKSWSENASPIAQAASRSAARKTSTAAAQERIPAPKHSAAERAS
jgi:hypothetical protein